MGIQSVIRDILALFDQFQMSILWYTGHNINLLAVWLLLTIQLYRQGQVYAILSAKVLIFQGSV